MEDEFRKTDESEEIANDMESYSAGREQDGTEKAIMDDYISEGENIILEEMTAEELREHAYIRNTKFHTNSPRHKRTKFEKEMDLVDEARLYLRGWPMAKIAEWITKNRVYSLSAPSVSLDMKVLRERWREHYMRDIDEIKSTELARLDRMEMEAWDAWDKSKEKKQEIERFKTTDKWTGRPDLKKPAYTRERLKHLVIERDPNPKYLEIVQWCIEQRIRVFGLDAPKQVNINWRKEAEAAGINPEEALSKLEEEFIEAARRGQMVVEQPDDSGGSREGSLAESAEETGDDVSDPEVPELPG